MKSKPLTYFLILAVVALWGLIIYKVIGAFSTPDTDDISPPVKTEKEAFNDYTIPKDTAKLLLNYRNPFGLDKPKDTVSATEKVSKVKIIPPPTKPVVNWSFITYSGYIRNPSNKKLVALVSINGQNTTLAEGETKSQVKLLKNMLDSIKVSYAGKVKFIPIKSSL